MNPFYQVPKEFWLCAEDEPGTIQGHYIFLTEEKAWQWLKDSESPAWIVRCYEFAPLRSLDRRWQDVSWSFAERWFEELKEWTQDDLDTFDFPAFVEAHLPGAEQALREALGEAQSEMEQRRHPDE